VEILDFLGRRFAAHVIPIACVVIWLIVDILTKDFAKVERRGFKKIPDCFPDVGYSNIPLLSGPFLLEFKELPFLQMQAPSQYYYGYCSGDVLSQKLLLHPFFITTIALKCFGRAVVFCLLTVSHHRRLLCSSNFFMWFIVVLRTNVNCWNNKKDHSCRVWDGQSLVGNENGMWVLRLFLLMTGNHELDTPPGIGYIFWTKTTTETRRTPLERLTKMQLIIQLMFWISVEFWRWKTPKYRWCWPLL